MPCFLFISFPLKCAQCTANAIRGFSIDRGQANHQSLDVDNSRYLWPVARRQANQ